MRTARTPDDENGIAGWGTQMVLYILTGSKASISRLLKINSFDNDYFGEIRITYRLHIVVIVVSIRYKYPLPIYLRYIKFELLSAHNAYPLYTYLKF